MVEDISPFTSESSENVMVLPWAYSVARLNTKSRETRTAETYIDFLCLCFNDGNLASFVTRNIRGGWSELSQKYMEHTLDDGFGVRGTVGYAG